MITVPRYISLVSIILAAAAGCSQGVSVKTVPVTGKVTLDNQPLAGATVMFLSQAPADAHAPAVSTGLTGADGTYKLATMASGRDVLDGAPPGIYKVTIAKQAAAGGMSQGATPEMTEEERMQKMKSMSAEDMAKMAGTAAQPGAEGPKSDVPERYAKAAESGLTATVEETGAQTIDFPLTSK